MATVAQVKKFVRAVREEHDQRIMASLGGGSSGGGSSSGSAGGSAGALVLDTVPVTVDGGLWYEFDDDNKPVIRLRTGNYIYDFNSGSAKYAGGNSNLVSFLPFDTSTTEDACGVVWTSSNANNAVLDTENKKFGAACLQLKNYAQLKAENVINLNAAAWTFDCWAYTTAFTLRLGAVEEDDNCAIKMDKSYFQARDSSLNKCIEFGTGLNASTWFHIAITRSNNKIYCFVDGVLKGSGDAPAEFYSGSFFRLCGGNSANLRFDNVRFFEGVALWTSDFTPPTAADYD